MNLDPSLGVAVFTDGSANSQDRSGGWAWVALDAFEGMEIDSGACDDTTNNQMELTAPARALESLLDEFGPIDVLVYSDSQYVVLGITERTRKRNKNQSFWTALDHAVDDHHRVEFKHVKGHAGHEFNEQADRLASAARVAHDPTEDILRAEEGAGEEWIEEALEVLYVMAGLQSELTSGTLWEYLDLPPNGDPRAIGGVMRKGAAKGWITKTDRTEKWRPYRPGMTGNLGRTTSIWKSNICK